MNNVRFDLASASQSMVRGGSRGGSGSSGAMDQSALSLRTMQESVCLQDQVRLRWQHQMPTRP